MTFTGFHLKTNFVDKTTPNAKLVNAVFFNSPEMVGGWDIEPTYKGMYVQLSKKIIDENRFLFKNYLDYGLHEPLFLADNEIIEITTLFELMIKYYSKERQNFTVLLSYVNVLISLVESFYKRQFSTDPKEYNRIVTDFQQSIKEYNIVPFIYGKYEQNNKNFENSPGFSLISDKQKEYILNVDYSLSYFMESL